MKYSILIIGLSLGTLTGCVSTGGGYYTDNDAYYSTYDSSPYYDDFYAPVGLDVGYVGWGGGYNNWGGWHGGGWNGGGWHGGGGGWHGGGGGWHGGGGGWHGGGGRHR